MGRAVVFHLSNLPELLQGLVLRTVVVVNLFMAVVTVKLLKVRFLWAGEFGMLVVHSGFMCL